MSKIALAKINSFAHVAQQADVQPSEPIFVLSSSQLQEIIKEAVSEAIQPLEDDVQDLREIVAIQREKMAALEVTQDLQAENSFIQLQLINDLRKDKKPQPLQRDRGEILRALIVANGGKMLAKEARLKMRLSKNRFSELLAASKEDIEIREYRLKKNQNVLVLK